MSEVIPTATDTGSLPAGAGAPSPSADASADGPAAPSRNFCSGCGSVWQPEWAVCPVCALRGATRAAVAAAPPERSQVGPSLGLYFTLLAATGVGMLVGLGGGDQGTLLMYLSAAHAMIVLCWTVWGRREVLPALVQPVAVGWYAVAIVGAVCTFAAASGAIAALRRATGMRSIEMAAPLLSHGGWPMVILIVCVQPAIFEELGFRGVILPALQPTLAPLEAVFVSALLFMTLHLSIPSFPHLFLIGLALGYLRVRTRSLLPGMLMHFTHNLLCVVAERYWG